MNEKEYYSVKEIQEILGICRQTAYKYLDKKSFNLYLKQLYPKTKINE